MVGARSQVEPGGHAWCRRAGCANPGDAVGASAGCEGEVSGEALAARGWCPALVQPERKSRQGRAWHHSGQRHRGGAIRRLRRGG